MGSLFTHRSVSCESYSCLYLIHGLFLGACLQQHLALSNSEQLKQVCSFWLSIIFAFLQTFQCLKRISRIVLCKRLCILWLSADSFKTVVSQTGI
jgi:hypothetical protein